MKHYFTTFILCLSIFSCFGQLTVTEDLKPTNESISELIQRNDLDYAVITWPTSNWISIKNEYSGFVRKSGKSFLVQISISKYAKEDEKITVKQEEIQKRQSDSLINAINADSTFLHKQKDFDVLSKGCPYMENGVRHEMQIYDGGYIHLLRYSNNKFEALKAYAPKYFLENCHSRDYRFDVLQHFVRTYDSLLKTIESKR